ncbi:unnamed protein product [Aspergillus oryzae]|uniref:Unnamed protein product n=1 Tax=Aspergillus oryzae TaxID=5062 RepID=A0AAN5BWM0_ASPOZ|nr:unnamed protein product [Aspergillus oryzae]GMG28968.1 unnamed protein product [Aspergillus oryzae]
MTSRQLWNYSLPSAIVLANALRKCAELGKDMSTPLSWADLYRQLNVLAADLETSSDPTDSNYSLYNERRHSFSKQLDHALNARLERPPLKTRPGASISSNLPMDHMDIFTDIGGDEFTDTLIDIGPMDVVFDDWDLLPHRPFNDPEGCRLGKPLGGIVDARQEELKPTLLIMSTLHRMETKLENLPVSICNDLQSRQRPIPRTVDSPSDTSTPGRSSQGINIRTSVTNPLAQGLTPDAIEHDDFEFDENQKVTNSNGLVSISFSQHGVILWPGARDILPKRLLEAHERLGKNYVIDIEAKRPQLPMYICPYPPQAGDDWLEALPLAMIKGLSDAFFATFNPFTPIMDKNFYFSFTIWAAIESGFGYTMESCLVLNILALGCHAVQAHQEGNYPLPGTRSNRFEPPDWMAVIHEEPLGLRFFNEARRRIGFLMCDNDLQSCQFYMLSSYATHFFTILGHWLIRYIGPFGLPSLCGLLINTSSHDVNFDEWEGDMKSRVYWNCLMNETILVQELHLPPSGLARLEEFVPIPKFITFETVGLVPPRSSSQEVDDSFFQYHFLAQVAHRIILTRIRHSLYFYSDSGTFPLPAINSELHHQLEQWRLNLPPAIQFQDTHATTPANPNNPTTTTPITSPSTPISPLPLDPNRPLSPATAVSEAMLRGRFKIAKFHIGRPYLYKALRIPASLSEDDLGQVRSGLQNAMDWPVVGGVFQNMKSCIPIKFAFCSQYVSFSFFPWLLSNNIMFR